MDAMNPKLMEDLSEILSGVDLGEDSAERLFGEQERGRFTKSAEIIVESVIKAMPNIGLVQVSMMIDGEKQVKPLTSWPVFADTMGRFFVENFYKTPVRVEITSDNREHSFVAERVKYDPGSAEHRMLTAAGSAAYLYAGAREEYEILRQVGNDGYNFLSLLLGDKPSVEDLWMTVLFVSVAFAPLTKVDDETVEGFEVIKSSLLSAMSREECFDVMEQFLRVIPEEYQSVFYEHDLFVRAS